MGRPEAAFPSHHRDPAFFTEAVAFTAARLGFVPALIEKDYFCSVVLAYLAGALNEALVFKGGTCLTKVHAGFYRLSEALDFTMPMPIAARQSDRSRTIKPVKQALREMSEALPELHEEEVLRGANGSRQYVGSLRYDSLLQRRRETIKIEISLREPLLQTGRIPGCLDDPDESSPPASPSSSGATALYCKTRSAGGEMSCRDDSPGVGDPRLLRYRLRGQERRDRSIGDIMARRVQSRSCVWHRR
jgi:hypothetical protein